MTEYVCEMCNKQRVETDRYAGAASVAYWCETCGHVADFVRVSGAE